jgi:hypothetical protein
MGARHTVAVLVAFGLVCSAGPAWGVVDHNAGGRPDIEVKGAPVAPTSAQRAIVTRLGARAAWNRLGTPSSLIKPGGYLGRGVRGTSAVAAARSWLAANRGLFRLSSLTGLELERDAELAQSEGHAVTFRQTFGDLKAAGGGGLVTVGITRDGDAWKVASASSTVTGDESIAGRARIGAERAWQDAAASVGDRRSLAQIRPATRGRLRGWRVLAVSGRAEPQRVRLVAFPTLRDGVVPAYESLVLDTERPLPEAYQVFVDARDGEVLARRDMVDNSHEGPPPVFTFTGSLPAADAGCDTRKGPYAVAADDHVRAIDVFAGADAPLQQIVLRLYRDGTQVAEADEIVPRERIRYAPPGGVPPGDYFVEVCDDTGGGPPVEPRSYRGTVTLDTTAAPPPYTARWTVFPANPPLHTVPADPWNHPSTDTRERWCWRLSTAADCTRAVGNLASRAPWDHDTRTGQSTSTTIGNNAVTAESWTHPLLPSPSQFRPVSATRDYTFPWTNAWNRADCNPGTPYGSAFAPGQSFDIAAAVTNLFAMHNRMHDWSYHLGFTEENWNAQTDNFGLTEPFRGNDPVVGDAQAGALVPPPDIVRDNANMITLPDGQSSVTNMYLWQPVAAGFYAPCVDGDYDMAVIGHEYGHMIENRMVGKGHRRSGHHAGAMGESVGDLMAVEYLNENGFVPTSDENPFAVGAYATGEKTRGIRNYAGNFPSTGAFPTPSVYSRVNPLNFSDIGYDLPGPQVHADGEIWTATNIDIREALAAKYGAQFPAGDRTRQARCANGILPADECPGNRRWIQLLLDAFLLMPTNPSMLDARNAVLSADMMRFGGANQNELWLAFARRGMGRNAAATNTTGRVNGVESDTNPLPDFEAPNQPGVPVTFNAVELGSGTAVPARVYVGHYEGRVSPIADTDPATTAPAGSPSDNLDATATFAPGTYEFVAHAPGYGHVRFRRTLAAGPAQTVTLRMAPNWASGAQGARATGNVSPVTSEETGAEILSNEQVLARLIDDTEATNWQAAATRSGDAFAVAGKQVTINLGGRAHPIERVQVSAALGPVYDPEGQEDLTQNRYTALRAFEVWACDNTRDRCGANSNAYRLIYSSPDDAFPGDAPRPVQPTLILREFDVSRTRASHLRVVVRSSQCTGGPDFQGDQDADPFNATDCDTAGGAASRFVRIAEVQAFSSGSEAR